MSDQKTVSFNRHNAKLFVKEYNKARQDEKEVFVFHGGEYVVSYAYYLIQYLEINNMIEGKFNEDKTYTIK